MQQTLRGAIESLNRSVLNPCLLKICVGRLVPSMQLLCLSSDIEMKRWRVGGLLSPGSQQGVIRGLAPYNSSWSGQWLADRTWTPVTLSMVLKPQSGLAFAAWAVHGAVPLPTRISGCWRAVHGSEPLRAGPAVIEELPVVLKAFWCDAPVFLSSDLLQMNPHTVEVVLSKHLYFLIPTLLLWRIYCSHSKFKWLCVSQLQTFNFPLSGVYLLDLVYLLFTAAALWAKCCHLIIQ